MRAPRARTVGAPCSSRGCWRRSEYIDSGRCGKAASPADGVCRVGGGGPEQTPGEWAVRVAGRADRDLLYVPSGAVAGVSSRGPSPAPGALPVRQGSADGGAAPSTRAGLGWAASSLAWGVVLVFWGGGGGLGCGWGGGGGGGGGWLLGGVVGVWLFVGGCCILPATGRSRGRVVPGLTGAIALGCCGEPRGRPWRQMGLAWGRQHGSTAPARRPGVVRCRESVAL